MAKDDPIHHLPSVVWGTSGPPRRGTGGAAPGGPGKRKSPSRAGAQPAACFDTDSLRCDTSREAPRKAQHAIDLEGVEGGRGSHRVRTVGEGGGRFARAADRHRGRPDARVVEKAAAVNRERGAGGGDDWSGFTVPRDGAVPPSGLSRVAARGSPGVQTPLTIHNDCEMASCLGRGHGSGRFTAPVHHFPPRWQSKRPRRSGWPVRPGCTRRRAHPGAADRRVGPSGGRASSPPFCGASADG